MDKVKIYNPVIDILRVISILAVILIHTTTRTLEVSAFNIQQIPFTILLNQLSRFTVPLFFMISGFVLELNFHLNESYLQYLKKRASRIFIPYIFWSLIYYNFIYPVNRDPNFFNSILTGNASYQLYFIPSLVVFYILFPLIHRFFKYIGNRWVILTLAIIELVLLLNDYYFKPLNIHYLFQIVILNFFVFIFGMHLARNKEKFIVFLNKYWFLFLSTALIMGCFIFYEGFYGYLQTKNYLTIYSQWRPSVLIYTLSLGGILYWIFQRFTKFLSVIKKLSSLSFFVFFIHVIILEKVWTMFLKNFVGSSNNKMIENFWYDPMYFLIVALISYGIAFIIHKIPYASKITG